MSARLHPASAYKPHIFGKVLTSTTVPIHAFIICDSNGVAAVSENTVAAWIADANRIYRQVAMTFTLASVQIVTNRTDWFDIDSDVRFYNITSYTNMTGGLELYCVGGMYVPGLHSDMRLAYGDAMRGMAVRADADLPVLSHEIGHACGLSNMYEYDAGEGLVSEEKTYPLNWSGGEKTGYYAQTLAYRELTYRVIMHNHNQTDIPLYYLSGMYESLRVPISVGLQSNMNRQPAH